MAESYYDLKKASDGQFMFNLKAPNHEVIATSERYTTKSAAQEGIRDVRKHASTITVKDNT